MMREAQKGLKEIMQVQLAVIADNMITQIMSSARKLTPSKRLDALHDVSPKGIQEYRSLLLDGIVLIAEDGMAAARKEVPKAKKVKLARIDKLPPKLRDKMKTRTELLIGKQIGDLLNVISFAYATNEDTTDSDDTVEQDLRDSALGWLDGTALEAGASLTASTVINEARDAFFFDPEVLEEIEAFQFVNGDPVTDICADLAGTIFAKDDPDMFRYTPPLHWNCKSYIIPILVGNLGSREIEKLKPSTKKLESEIQFQEIFSVVKECKEHENGGACH
jgi:hypothetical protein